MEYPLGRVVTLEGTRGGPSGAEKVRFPDMGAGYTCVFSL